VLAVMLGNLIRNTILYTDEGDIEIIIDDSEITISDSGPGIPPSKLKRIFEPFDRPDMDENVADYGIGLTIVKRLCDRFGWQINVASFADQGSRFIITFASADGERSKRN
jgi:signal transduction histidine kinase